LDELVAVAGLLVEQDEDGRTDVTASLATQVSTYGSSTEPSLVSAVQVSGSPMTATLPTTISVTS
jgi:hypothetical protein